MSCAAIVAFLKFSQRHLRGRVGILLRRPMLTFQHRHRRRKRAELGLNGLGFRFRGFGVEGIFRGVRLRAYSGFLLKDLI